jgi:ABC-2 type transport system ATP-binding protein
MEMSIEVKHVSKNFGKTKALNDVSLKLTPGKIYGLLGRNGAGKSTLLNIITNKLFADGGEVLIDGEPAQENDNAQGKVYHMTDKNLHPQEMRVKEGLKWARVFYPEFDQSYANSLIQKFSLDTRKRIKALSTGYQSIFKLILTLASGAPILLFDEPVLGLDANFRELFYRELIAYCSQKPKTVVISTHLIDEVANVLEEVVIIKNGSVILTQPVEEVLQLAYTVSGEAARVAQYTQGKNVIRRETIGKYEAATIYQQRAGADENAVKGLGLEITPARLQELFISLTND